MSYGYLKASTGFVVECWFKRSTTNIVYETLFSQYTQASPSYSSQITVNGRQFWLGFHQTTSALMLMAAKEDGTLVVNWTDPSPVGYPDDDTWHHVAVRMMADKITWRVWLDGAILASITGSAAVNWNPGLLTVGGAYAPHLGLYGADLYQKTLANVAVVNVPLAGARVVEHYAAGNSGTVYYGDDEVERLTRILDWTDTPLVCRDLDEPLTTLQGIEVAGTNALDALMDTSDSARGYSFADGHTWIQYHNKRHRYNKHVVFTFSESIQSSPESGVDFITDEEKIFNDIRGKRPYGGSYRMKDNVSIDEFGRRTYEFSVAITSSEELRNTVGWLLSRYGTAHLRVSGLTLRAESSEVIEEAVGRIEIGDHIVFDELPEYAPVRDIELTVEGISMNANFTEKYWEMSFNLSPAEFDRVFQVGVSTVGDNKVAL